MKDEYHKIKRQKIKIFAFFAIHLLTTSLGLTGCNKVFFKQKKHNTAAAGLVQELKDQVLILENNFSLKKDAVCIVVNPEVQKLFLVKGDQVLKTYIISTGEAGIGNMSGSFKTPHGVHTIYIKIGENEQIGTVFVNKVSTTKISPITTEKIRVDADFITTRILVLDGLEDGINKGATVDSKDRCIYIHGTVEEGLLGLPVSHGCIRMKNIDIIELFDNVNIGTLVYIQNKEYKKP